MVGLRISATIRLAYMTSLLRQPISGLDAIPPGQTAAVITNTANAMQLGISERLATFVSGVSLVISAMIIAFLYNWKLTLVTSSGLVIIILCYSITVPLVVKKMKQVEESEIKAAGVATEAFGNVRMIAACGAESKMTTRFKYWAEETQKRGLKMAKFMAAQQAIGQYH
jgi:ATP-binding cassette, subfamily B (MDR/TAP), member 1